MKENKNAPYKYLAFISQIGISVLTPIAIMIFFGKLIENYFNVGTWVVILFAILGALAGFRNLYVIPMRLNEKAIKEKKEQQEADERDRDDE